MRKLIALTISLFLFSLLTSNALAENTNEKLFVSPSLKVINVNDNQNEITEKIIIKNTYSTPINLELKPALFRLRNGNMELYQKESELIKNIELGATSVTLRPNETILIDVKVIKPLDFKDFIYPAISVNEVNTLQGQVPANFNLYSILFIEKVNGAVNFEVSVNVEEYNLFSKSIKLTGVITNTGEKVINPTGSIKVTKQGSRIYLKEISSQITEPLLPGRSVLFEEDFSFDTGHILNDSGIFNFSTEVVPQPYSETRTVSTDVLILDRNLTIISLVILVIVIIISGYLISLILEQNKKRRQKK